MIQSEKFTNGIRMAHSPLQDFINYKAETSMQCGNYSIDLPPLKDGEQYRFHFDMTACVGCHCCEVACNEQNNNPADVKWRRVGEMESGEFPTVSTLFNSMSCNHCIDPACLNGCPTNSYIKLENGIVYHEDDSCIGCQYCTWNCPYQVPVFNKDRGIVTKCHMCHEKLAVGETPACVQACPSGAIQIEVVNKNEWIQNDMAKSGVAPHLPDINITKPTTRYTLPKIQAKVTPADEHLIIASHSELPLVFMTVLTQISFGGFVGLFFGELLNLIGFNLATPNIWIVLAVLLPSLIGLPLSALHLGRPVLAMTAMKNLKTSWLSREAFALLIYATFLVLLSLLYLSYAPQFLKFIIEIIVFASGLYGIYAQSMIYKIPARPSWNMPQTSKVFFGVGYIGLFLIAFILLLMNESSSANIAIMFGFVVAIFQFIEYGELISFYKSLKDKDEHFYQLNKTKQLYEKYQNFNLVRKWSLVIGGLILPILTILFIASANLSVAVILLLLSILFAFVSELIARVLFYITASSYGLAGNFFAGSQR